MLMRSSIKLCLFDVRELQITYCIGGFVPPSTCVHFVLVFLLIPVRMYVSCIIASWYLCSVNLCSSQQACSPYFLSSTPLLRILFVLFFPQEVQLKCWCQKFWCDWSVMDGCMVLCDIIGSVCFPQRPVMAELALDHPAM